MKIAAFRYDGSHNVGDNIQTLAVTQHLKTVDFYIDRDSLNSYDGEECVVVMNGWFSDKVENWPPSEAITPIFFGFHMTTKAAAAYRASADYFKRFQPIGCRDQGTADILREWGVDAYVTGCATMTFPDRQKAPDDGLEMLIDVPRKRFRKADRSAFWGGGHFVMNVAADAKLIYAKGVLDFYRTRAKRVVTGRLHCALPCAAMGIPVAYVGETDYRTNIISMVGVSATPRSRFRALRLDDMRFSSGGFEERKQSMIADLKARLSAAGVATL